ncbi:hypothetical protein [Poseidonibacter ostreae]|jgi:uncharacterized membrane protein (DUF4010 family)|uniref:Uncharacterized protein n=1 Tax=Poseidonibacter ostreae TaxID=2654171 RepID=A0ABQ6VQB8_9BACT|nr:hypothetical protein [Poseidonibacter ostreae]KAB7882011.1 hypothetical protein GA417_13730 [Poseidonibacter ostreae]KAB7892925.1 hypothetical protein GBG18_00180 [Poseidonibacter ostreae]MAC82737.1 hypothetical protein [Arcobacter sp.]|tara:strand:- start:13775 stop:14170 length:396 start_codon:yes stop_codon:yes gene_type:complete
MSPRNLFVFSLIAIISVYLYVFGQEKTIELIKEEYLFILALFPITLTFFYFKMKVKGKELIDFNKNNSFSLKNTIIFFLIFQVVDYISEDGFLGMISMWFLYWIMGLIALLIMETINYYRNYKLNHIEQNE